MGEAKWWKRVGSALAGVEAATRSTALGTVLKYAYEKWYCPPLFSRFLLTLCWGEGEREREGDYEQSVRRTALFIPPHRSVVVSSSFLLTKKMFQINNSPPPKKKTGS